MNVDIQPPFFLEMMAKVLPLILLDVGKNKREFKSTNYNRTDMLCQKQRPETTKAERKTKPKTASENNRKSATSRKTKLVPL